MIIERSTGLCPVEIKSGWTLKEDAFTGLHKWLQLAGQDAEYPCLCYGGEEGYERSGVTVVPWRRVSELNI